MDQPKQINQNYVNQSLANQLADLHMQLATRDAVITEQYEKMAEMEKELQEYRDKEITEMDKESSAKEDKKKPSAK